MQPQIIFLGTGGDCFVVGKQLRASGGIIIRANDMQFHIDPGPGSVVRAMQYDVNLRENTCILLSHSHINHASDINAVISSMTHGGLDKKGVLITNKTAVEGNENISPMITPYYMGCLERVITALPDQRIGVGDIEIKTTPTKHGIENIGFKFVTPDFTLSYVSDTVNFTGLAESHKDSEIIIMNVVNPSGVSSKINMNSDDAVEIIKKVKPKLAIIQHFGIKMINADPMYEAREIQKKTDTQVIAAKDGMVINPLSYSSSLRQKKLDSF
ncbi:MAG: MBL fold metallo-hydrolase [Candidatus Nanoarchaeia archaeon]|nr:MBL fold metallo-hydrolase [Candidatus Nanoarchaeia archaeon]